MTLLETISEGETVELKFTFIQGEDGSRLEGEKVDCYYSMIATLDYRTIDGVLQRRFVGTESGMDYWVECLDSATAGVDYWVEHLS
jgi:hypothetical protein